MPASLVFSHLLRKRIIGSLFNANKFSNMVIGYGNGKYIMGNFPCAIDLFQHPGTPADFHLGIQ